MTGYVGSKECLPWEQRLICATKQMQPNTEREEDQRRRPLRTAGRDECGRKAVVLSEPESVRLGLGETNGSSFWGKVSKGKINELLRLEVPPVTYRPKRWRKRPRRAYRVFGGSGGLSLASTRVQWDDRPGIIGSFLYLRTPGQSHTQSLALVGVRKAGPMSLLAQTTGRLAAH